ncbi:major capsid protein [Megalodesulfovibrio paquesii]
MSFTIDYFDPRLLTGVINKRPVKLDLFGSFFVRQPPSPVELFELHVKTRNVSILPAITNHAPGTMRRSDGIAAGAVKAPRFRPKRAFMAADRFRMPAGVNPYDPTYNAVERAIAEDMDLHREEIDLSTEIMCCQALVQGKIELFDVIEGAQAVPTFTVDFKRPAHHTVVLTGDALWSASASDLPGQMDAWNLMILEETGYGATDLLLGKDAWAVFRKHADVKDDLDNKGIDIGQLSPRVGSKLKGVWNGLRVWVVIDTYTDLNGETRHCIAPDTAVLVARDATSVIEYGMPVDNDCAGPVAIFSKAFKQEDPSGTFSIAESRPLPWSKQPGWVVVAKVL